jgi:hypothetical protein
MNASILGLYAQTVENSVKLDFELPQSGAALCSSENSENRVYLLVAKEFRSTSICTLFFGGGVSKFRMQETSIANEGTTGCVNRRYRFICQTGASPSACSFSAKPR